MPAQTYSQYFNIDEKYYAVVTKELIDEGKVKWEGFYPHETFVQLLHQVVTMLSGKETKSIWVEGSYGTGKSHATLTLKCLLEAPEEAVRAYFKDYGLSEDLCNKFLAARSEEMNGKLILSYRIGSSNIKNDDDLIWAIQDSISRSLQDAGINNMAAGTMKDALLDWINEKPANRNYLASLISEAPQSFGGMNLDMILQILNSDDEKGIENLMEKLVNLCRENGILAMNMDSEKLAAWLEEVIDKNGLGAILFIWDEFSEYFKNCQNSLTGFQNLIHVSFNKPFYFVIVTHESEGLIVNQSDRSKISNRFIEPRVHIELPDNMAFQLMAQAMKETDDPVMSDEWNKVKQGLNARLGSVRSRITNSAKKHAKGGSKTILNDDDLQKIVPLHPYAALMLKHISRVFTASQRSMFDFIVARDPDEDRIKDSDENILTCRAFKWFINHNGVATNSLMTVDMLWDFFNAKAGGNMNSDALEILNNFDTLKSEYHLNPDEQRVLKTILLMNAICTRVQDADSLTPTYENIDLAFLGTGWQANKAANIARAMVHREPPLQPVLFEEPMQDGTMRVIPKATGGVDIQDIKQRIRSQLSTKDLVESAGFVQALRIPDNLTGHFTSFMLFVNPRSSQTFLNGFRDAKMRAFSNPDHFQVGIMLAMSDEERSEAGRMIQTTMKEGIPENLVLLDATTNTFTTYLENYITNRAYSEYYLKSDKKQSNQFASYAQKNLTSWKDQVVDGEFRLYDNSHKNGQMRMTYSAMTEVLQELDRQMYPYGIEQYSVNPTMFTRSVMGQGAEYGLQQLEKGSFTSGNPATRLSTALKGAWKEEGEYWKDPAKQNLTIVQLKKKVEEVIHNGFEKNGTVQIIEILDALSERPFGFTASNLSAYVMGFLLKEYVSEQYFWTNGTTKPMTIELMKSAIKNAMDQSVAPKAGYRPESIQTMSDDIRTFLQGTARLFHENLERCGNVGDAAGIIRLGMKKLDFPIWALKSLLDREDLKTDTSVIAGIIDSYLGIANPGNYVTKKVDENDLAKEIGQCMLENSELVSDLEKLFISSKSREGMKAYLDEYRGGELPSLAMTVKDNGNYISEVKKKFNAESGNWLWAPETANSLIDETITEYGIIAESNAIIAPSTTYTGCLRNWKDRINNFRISLEAMAPETGDLQELLEILYAIRQSPDGSIPGKKKTRFLELLREQKSDFNYLYAHQEEIFKRIAQGWLSELTDDDISELFQAMDTGVFCASSDQFFKNVDQRVKAYMDAQRSRRLSKLWYEKTSTQSPAEWSRKYLTPILCMFEDHERQEAKEIFTILHKSKPSEAEFKSAEQWLSAGTFYERLSSEEERERCMRERIIRDYVYLLPDVNQVRNYLKDKASMITPYEWIDSNEIQNKIREMALMRYKTGGASDAEKAVADLGIDELREYVRKLIRTDMSVGIAILKRQKQ